MPGLTLRMNQPQDLRPRLRRRPGADRLAGNPIRRAPGPFRRTQRRVRKKACKRS